MDDHLTFYEADGIDALAPGATGFLVVMRRQSRRQRFVRWVLRRRRPVEVFPVTVTGVDDAEGL